MAAPRHPLFDDVSMRFETVCKPDGGPRTISVLRPGDADAYRCAVARLAEMIERVLGPQVFANRVTSATGLELEPWGPAWRRFRGRVARLVDRAPFVVRADVRECYPAIRPAVAEGALLDAGSRADDARRVRAMLERFHDAGVAGLPIGPDASAVVANAVLARADRAVACEGSDHVRWVDDVWSTAESRPHALRILDALHRSLAGIGLELNEAKTAVLERADALAVLDAAPPSGTAE